MKRTVYILILLFCVNFITGCDGNTTNNLDQKKKISLKGDPFKAYPETFNKVKNKIKENNQQLEDKNKKTQELFNI